MGSSWTPEQGNQGPFWGPPGGMPLDQGCAGWDSLPVPLALQDSDWGSLG